MFERGPFQTCLSCQKANSLGILSAGGSTITRRCRHCRFSYSEELPAVDKKIVYLDQLAISEIFKAKSGSRRPGNSREDFWSNVEREANRAYLLQQVIFPASNIHRDETIVSPFSNELSLAHEMLSGDTSFHSIDEVNMHQVREFAKAYWEKRPPPELTFEADDILEGRRNSWLRDLHITVNMDFSAFADRTRASRDAAASEFLPLLKRWAKEKPKFRDALDVELRNYGDLHRSTLRHAAERAARSFASADPIEFFEGLSHPVMDQFRELKAYFERQGVSPNDSAAEVNRYWDWRGNELIPTHRISAYLFAALARRMASGQKRFPSRGMFNDINAISTYGPYVDAMFLDNECAELLSERPLSTDLELKAKIFSTRSGDAFLEYLRDLQESASPAVRRYASEIYGLAP